MVYMVYKLCMWCCNLLLGSLICDWSSACPLWATLTAQRAGAAATWCAWWLHRARWRSENPKPAIVTWQWSGYKSSSVSPISRAPSLLTRWKWVPHQVFAEQNANPPCPFKFPVLYLIMFGLFCVCNFDTKTGPWDGFPRPVAHTCSMWFCS